MTKAPSIICDGWGNEEQIPIVYTAPIEPNIQPPGEPQPENRKPYFTFSNVPVDTVSIALVVHDILDGDLINGEKAGWTHYTALFSPQGLLLQEGGTSEDRIGWVGPYPEEKGEYHCTAYFLSEQLSAPSFTRADILKFYGSNGLGIANMIGKYTNPLSVEK